MRDGIRRADRRVRNGPNIISKLPYVSWVLKIPSSCTIIDLSTYSFAYLRDQKRGGERRIERQLIDPEAAHEAERDGTALQHQACCRNSVHSSRIIRCQLTAP